MLFESSVDYKTFILYVISNILNHTWITLSAYCILPNMFYFVVKNDDKWFKLSDFMRKIQVSYAMYFKKKHEEKEGIKGIPVFQWRFVAKIIWLNMLEEAESCVSFEPLNQNLTEEIRNWPYTSAHQILDTGYDYKNDIHIKIYNDWRKIQKKFFENNIN